MGSDLRYMRGEEPRKMTAEELREIIDGFSRSGYDVKVSLFFKMSEG